MPRLRLDYPLSAAGVVPFEAVADYRREVTVPLRPAPTLDGALDDPTWEGALVLEAFTTSAGLSPTTDPTVVMLAHDGESLYFAARCAEPDPSRLARLHEGRDGHVVYDDRIGMLLAPGPDRIAWFYVNPNGAVWDLLVDRAEGVVRRDWDEVEAAAAVGEAAWTVEARIPLADLGPTTGDWAFDIRRKQIAAQAEAVYTPAFGMTTPGRVGVLRFDGQATP